MMRVWPPNFQTGVGAGAFAAQRARDLSEAEREPQ
jgi:hypothetical protein